jgi:NADH dehydrogenase FAD-containing subunit
MTRESGAKRVLLVGAGHAHLHVIANAQRFVELGHSVTVLSPGPFWYSGLATGMVGGTYCVADDQVDVAALARKHGARFVGDAAIGFDIAVKTVVTEGNSSLEYDVLSLNLGSDPPHLPGENAPSCYRVKPIPELARMREDLLRRFASGPKVVRVVVAGGGATAAELALNIDALARRARAETEITIVGGRRASLKQLRPGPARSLMGVLERRGIILLRGRRVERIADGSAELSNGEAITFDLFLNAAGLHPSEVVARTGLPVDGSGALRVNSHLRSIADDSVHAAGDCMSLEGNPLAKIGVYAIRQAPVLLANLLAAAQGTQPQTFVPQKRYLWIINLGDGTGLAMRGGLWWRGRSAFWLKDRIDRRFLGLYQA